MSNNFELHQPFGLSGYDMRRQEPHLIINLDVSDQLLHLPVLPAAICVLNRVFTREMHCDYSTSNGSVDGKLHYYLRIACPTEAIVVKTRNGKVISATTTVLDEDKVNQIQNSIINNLDKQKQNMEEPTSGFSLSRLVPQAFMGVIR